MTLKNLPPDCLSWPDLPPWAYISSAQLAAILGVSLQSIWNWRVRQTGPPSVPAAMFRGPKRWYRIAEVKAWLMTRNGQPTTASDLIAAWIDNLRGFRTPTTAENIESRIALLDQIYSEKRRGQPRRRAGAPAGPHGSGSGARAAARDRSAAPSEIAAISNRVG